MTKMRNGMLLALVVGSLLALGLFRSAKADVAPLCEKAIWDLGVSSGADVLTSSITPTTAVAVSSPNTPTITYRVTVALRATDSILYLRMTKSGGGSYNYALNGGTALTAGNLYSFLVPANQTFTYNVRVGTSTTLGLLQIDRYVDGGF